MHLMHASFAAVHFLVDQEENTLSVEMMREWERPSLFVQAFAARTNSGIINELQRN